MDMVEKMYDDGKLTPKNDKSISEMLAKFGWSKPVTPVDKLVEFRMIDSENAQIAEACSGARWFENRT